MSVNSGAYLVYGHKLWDFEFWSDFIIVVFYLKFEDYKY